MLTIPSHIIRQNGPGDLALLDARNGSYHALNDSAVDIWRAVGAGAAPDMIDDTKLARRPGAIPALVEESVMLDMDSDTVLRLNGSAVRIGEILDEPRTVAALCKALVARSDVALEQCRADVVALLASIGERGLIVTGG